MYFHEEYKLFFNCLNIVSIRSMIRSWQITSLCTDVHLPTEKFALNSTELKSVE